MQNDISSPQELESIINNMKKLLIPCESIKKDGEIRNKIQMLEIWLKIYKHGLSAARKISEAGPVWLDEFSLELKKSAEELERFSNEGGGCPITDKQAKAVEKFNKAAINVRQVASELENIMPGSDLLH